MTARLGYVLYWVACIISALIFLAGIVVWFTEGHARSDGIGVLIGFVVAAIIAWAIGWVLRYILAGTK